MAACSLLRKQVPLQVGLGMNIMSGAQAAEQGMGSSASASASAMATDEPDDSDMPPLSRVSKSESLP